MGALAVLPAEKERARDCALYTTLSPCPMCFGAIVVARLGQVHLGAIDPTWSGIERLPELAAEVQRRWPLIHGPLSGPVGAWPAIAPALNTTGALMRAMEATHPANAALSRAVHRHYQRQPLLPGCAVEAWESTWDLLSGAAG